MNNQVYINALACISPQDTLNAEQFLQSSEFVSGSPMRSIEPTYKEHIDRRYLRRMGRMVRMGVAAATKALADADIKNPDAILVGTGMGCLEDTEKFLRAIYESDENIASPNQFIQSTHNNVAAQIALMLGCYNYNFTYVHRGFSFESAMLDAILHVQEAGENKTDILVGACDELTDMYLEVTSKLNIWKSKVPRHSLKYNMGIKSEQGEGAAFFAVSNQRSQNTIASLDALRMVYKPQSSARLTDEIDHFLARQSLTLDDIDLVLLGYDGGGQKGDVYDEVVNSVFDGKNQAVYKHLCGEYKTAGAFATWLSCEMIRQQHVPEFVKWNAFEIDTIRRVLIFNNYNSANFVLSLLSHV